MHRRSCWLGWQGLGHLREVVRCSRRNAKTVETPCRPEGCRKTDSTSAATANSKQLEGGPPRVWAFAGSTSAERKAWLERNSRQHAGAPAGAAPAHSPSAGSSGGGGGSRPSGASTALLGAPTPPAAST